MKKRFAVVIEQGATNYGAYVPDLPGCVAAGDTVEEVERLIREAVPFHIEGMRQNGDPIPEPTTLVGYVETQAARPGLGVPPRRSRTDGRRGRRTAG